jgi:5-methylcytosine-specific restriction endonuclease McrA
MIQKRDSKGRFVKGIIPWNKNNGGYHFSEDFNKRRSKMCKDKKICRNFGEYSKKGNKGAHLGHHFKHSEDAKKRIRIAKTGINNPRWTGGKKSCRTSIAEWYIIRQLVLERDNFKCRICGRMHHEILLDVHHIVPWRISKDNSVGNLITLCRSCHLIEEQKIIKQKIIRGENMEQKIGDISG